MLLPLPFPGPAASAAEVLEAALWGRERVEAAGFAWRGNSSGAQTLPVHLAAEPSRLPASFSWCSAAQSSAGTCTSSRNQHLPQFCESCWAHAALSALADRIKIMRVLRGEPGPDVRLSVQHVLNCANAGDCHGGSVDGPYQWLYAVSQATGSGVAFEDVNSYMACSPESREGICPYSTWACTPQNIAKTCFFPGRPCAALARYPNASISAFGAISGASAMKEEIFWRGPISCGIDSRPLKNYSSGMVRGSSSVSDHAVSVVGWGTDDDGQEFWYARNSWGEYWGEMGFFRVAMGPEQSLNLEHHCVWAVPSEATAVQSPPNCFADGSNCRVQDAHGPQAVARAFMPALGLLLLVLCCAMCRRD